MSAYVALFCLFSPKLYIIIFHPDKNVRKLTMNSATYKKTASSSEFQQQQQKKFLFCFVLLIRSKFLFHISILAITTCWIDHHNIIFCVGVFVYLLHGEKGVENDNKLFYVISERCLSLFCLLILFIVYLV